MAEAVWTTVFWSAVAALTAAAGVGWRMSPDAFGRPGSGKEDQSSRQDDRGDE
ncbi:hypothetical protein [Kitasatospora sp. NPDC051705]|uniref:hypothetical protein n=1 Tax=Kitasatospora sp. NPDC051705 TaxID=3364057 RepID=UPI0037ACB365